MKIVCGAAGALLVLWIFVEAFEAMVLPRRVTRPFRFTRLYYLTAWRTWGALAHLLWPGGRRETFLSLFGPLSLLTLFALWAAGLIAGFGLLHLAVTNGPAGLDDVEYLSGTTFTTLGYGDITPTGPAARLLAVMEAATGLGFFALVISYLPVLYQAFSNREKLISLLDARAGSPPAAGRLLLRLCPAPQSGGPLEHFLEEAERWSAEVLESHLSFPVLGFYRSQHDNQSWLATLVCALDTSALLLTIVDGDNRQQARLTFAMARHALVDLSLVVRRRPETPPERLSAARLRQLGEALRSAGANVRDDQAALAHLAELRGLYEPFAAGLAMHFSLNLPEVWPEDERPDNWQTSAWMRRANPLTALGVDARDDHFV
jgi:hypothetical protein